MVTYLELDDIESYEYVDDTPIVYDITVEDTSCYYIDCGKYILVHNSGKTWSILQILIFIYGMQQTGKIITIARSTYAEIKATAMRDFFTILNQYGLYNERDHNKTDHTYKINGNLFEFVGMDRAGMAQRGATRDYLFMNEANGMRLDDWLQLSVRTKGDIFIDYNPTSTESWIYEHVIPRDDCEFIHSTYLDNYDYLEPEVINEIEYWIGKDEFYEKVYVHGLRADIKGLIFTNVNFIDDVPDGARFIGYGLDFGFTNHPTALDGVYLNDGKLIIDEIIHEPGLTNPDIIDRAKAEGVDLSEVAVGDSAEPKSIAELRRLGWTGLQAAVKGPDSIRHGIDLMKRYPILLTKRSGNVKREFLGYKWATDKDGNVIKPEKPVDALNHSIDAVRYLVTKRLKPKKTLAIS